MEDISRLIKEARPMYLARKKRNNRIKAGVAMLFCAVMMNMFYPRTYVAGNEYGDGWAEFITTASTGSVIEDWGLPTDDYGLLMVG